jgi:hypothetical protein
MSMEYVTVSSSNIAQIGFDKDTSTLGVIFTNGSEYIYPSFPENMHSEFISASSHGSYFHQNIRYNYSFKRLR